MLPLLEVEALEIILNAMVAVLLLLYAMVEVALEALVPASFPMEKNAPFRAYVQSGGEEQRKNHSSSLENKPALGGSKACETELER